MRRFANLAAAAALNAARRLTPPARVLGYLLVISVAAMCGAKLGTWLVDEIDIDDEWLFYCVATTGAGMVAFMATNVAKALEALAEIYERGSVSVVVGQAALIFVTFCGVAAGLAAILNVPDLPSSSEVTVEVAPSSAPFWSRGAGVFYVTFDEDASAESLVARKGQGLDVSEGLQETIASIRSTLTACARARNRQIRVSVVGMSSSSPFSGVGAAESKRLNVETANTRAEVVARMLDDEEGLLDVRVAKFNSFDELLINRRFSDLDRDGHYDADLGALNRRAEIRVHDLAACEYASLEALTAAPRRDRLAGGTATH